MYLQISYKEFRHSEIYFIHEKGLVRTKLVLRLDVRFCHCLKTRISLMSPAAPWQSAYGAVGPAAAIPPSRAATVSRGNPTPRCDRGRREDRL